MTRSEKNNKHWPTSRRAGMLAVALSAFAFFACGELIGKKTTMNGAGKRAELAEFTVMHNVLIRVWLTLYSGQPMDMPYLSIFCSSDASPIFDPNASKESGEMILKRLPIDYIPPRSGLDDWPFFCEPVSNVQFDPALKTVHFSFVDFENAEKLLPAALKIMAEGSLGSFSLSSSSAARLEKLYQQRTGHSTFVSIRGYQSLDTYSRLKDELERLRFSKSSENLKTQRVPGYWHVKLRME